MAYEDMDDDLSFESEDLQVVDEFDAVESEDLELLQEIDFAALGINPQAPTEAKPGSEQKVLMLAARYAAGLPLWHGEDRYDHGPGLKASLSGLKFDA